MAEMIIHLRTNPQTGKKDIVVELHNDADAMPHEHEEQHKQLIDKLIEGGMLQAQEVGKIIVQRQSDESSTATETSETGTEQRQSHSEGS